METLQNAYRDDDDDVEITPISTPNRNPNPNFNQLSTVSPITDPNPELNSDSMNVDVLIVDSTLEKGEKTEVLVSEQSGNSGNDFMEEDVRNVSEIAVTPVIGSIEGVNGSNGNVGSNKKVLKKKSKNNSVWTKPTSRKGKKKAKNFGHSNNNGTHNNGGSNNATPRTEDAVLATPVPRLPDRNEDTIDAKICLSRIYKAEKVELSDDRLSAGCCKGYRMVRATRGVSEGAWYFEIKVVHLGETGHSRLGWSTDKGDLQAPVGYDGFSFGYRDIDGCKVHKAMREKYGEEGYKEGDVLGFYINLPQGDSFMPALPHLVLYKGQKYSCDSKEQPSKTVPGSEISFFKNGVCQGVAFKDLCAACYYPAASMYTLPNQPNCLVKFNFGPDFECFPTDFGDRPVPRPMIEVPFRGSADKVENKVENGAVDENKP